MMPFAQFPSFEFVISWPPILLHVITPLFLCSDSLQGGNRSRVQQPHHRVLMKNKQLSKRKRVAEKREKRHTGSSSEEKQVTVTGSLGPFSLLLQVNRMGIGDHTRGWWDE